MQNSVLISLRLQNDIEQAVRIEAARQRISRSEFVRQAVTEFLRQLDSVESAQSTLFTDRAKASG